MGHEYRRWPVTTMAFIVTKRWTFRNVLWDLRQYYLGQAASYFEKVARAR